MTEDLKKTTTSIDRLNKEILERKKTDNALAQRSYALGERVKELNCLYGISSLVEKPGISLEEVLQGTIDLIPSSWQYPEITCARIILKGQEYKTEKFREAIWKLASDITVDGDRVGTLEVYYLAEKPGIDEGPFMKEERHLIKAIAERLGRIIERKEVEEALRQSEQNLTIRNKIAQIFLTVSDEEIYGEVLQLVLKTMDSKYGVFGYIDENGALVVPSMTRGVWEKCNVPEKDIVFTRDTWGDSTWPHAIREKRIIYSNEPSTDVPEGHISILRHISLPILYRGESIGLFQVANKETEYEEKDLELLESIARYVAPVLHARLERDREEKERELAEEQLRKYGLKLEEMVEERTSELKEALDNLQRTQSQLLQSEKMASIGQLAAGTAHEINNPTTFVNLNAITMEKWWKLFEPILDKVIESGWDRELGLEKFSDMRIKFPKMIQSIKEGAARISSITNALREFARSDHEKKQLVDLQQVLESVAIMTENKYKYHADLVIENRSEIPKIFGNSQKLEQVFVNLIINAAQAIEEKKTHTMKNRDQSFKGLISIVTSLRETPEKRIEIVVKDNGTGVDADAMKKVFDPFFTTKPLGKGTGLGMSIAYGIIQDHGGTISVESAKGQGAAFAITLPLKIPKAERVT